MSRDVSEDSNTNESDTDGVPLADKPLDADLEDSMSLLWDMSAEKDVMYFLLENNILIMIRDNLDFSDCPPRLKVNRGC